MATTMTAKGQEGLADLQQMGAELKHQHDVITAQLTKVKKHLGSCLLTLKRAEAALEYMNHSKPSAKTYRQIGRLFVLEDARELAQHLESTITGAKSDEQRFNAVGEQLLKKANTVDEQLKDIITQIQRTYAEGIDQKTSN